MNGTIICVAADADATDAAVRTAAELGERFGARVVLVGIAHDFVEPVQTDRSGAVSPARLAELLESLATEGELGRIEQRFAVGDPVETLVDVAREEAAELILIGARPGLLRRTLRSSFARDLAATAPCPVVVVPPETEGAGTLATGERRRG